STSSSNVFSGFKGFSSFSSGNDGVGNDSKSSSNFAFNFGTTTSTITTAASSTATATTSTSSDSNNSSFTFGSKLSTGIVNPKQNGNIPDSNKIDIPSSSSSIESSTTKMINENKTNDDKESAVFLANLNKLNKSFVEHICQYTSNPKSIYDLTLVCEEYIAKCKKLHEITPTDSLKFIKNNVGNDDDVVEKSSDDNQKKMDSQSTIKSSFTMPSSTSLTKKSMENSKLFSFGVKNDAVDSSSSTSTNIDANNKKPLSSADDGNINKGFSFKLDSKITFGGNIFGGNNNNKDNDQQQQEPKKSLFPTTTFPTTNPISLFGSSSGGSNIMKKIEDSNTETATATGDGDNDDGGDGEHEQPPKVQSVEHNEDDAVYTKKCKLYYKKDENFVEKGLGFLYIKTPKLNQDDTKDSGGDGGKSQLLIRADTNMGTILLNIALIESLPITKADKGKGVLLTCIPNPPLDANKIKKNNNNDDNSDDNDKQTVTFLIRCKQSDCDELYDNLMKYKK
ncbi:Nuclear pore complex protein Nup50, partial [Dermatophagoides pteronyssinus]